MTSRGLAIRIAFAVAAFTLGGSARAADSPDTAAVLGKLHHSNQMEVAAGKLAEEKGQSKEVKSFGKTLVTDHSASDKKVMALAKSEKIELPAEAAKPDDDKMLDKLKSASGAEFDKTFAKDMLADHEKDIAEVKEARDKTTDTKLKSLLSATLPVLEKHRDLAQKLVDKGASASASGTNAAPAKK
jgi:putative membrane protein